MKDYAFVQVTDSDGDNVGIYCYLTKDLMLQNVEQMIDEAFTQSDEEPDDYLDKKGISRVFCDEVNI